MTRDELLAHVRDAAVEILGVESASVTLDAAFGDDLDADSLDLVELVMVLEERLSITVPEEELDSVVTVADAVDLLAAKTAQPA